MDQELPKRAGVERGSSDSCGLENGAANGSREASHETGIISHTTHTMHIMAPRLTAEEKEAAEAAAGSFHFLKKVLAKGKMLTSLSCSGSNLPLSSLDRTVM